MLELETKLAEMTDKIKTMQPSDWLQAMIDGLRQAKSDPYWQVDMNSYGYWDTSEVDEVPYKCFGCAATATLMMMLDTPYMAIAQEHQKSASSIKAYSDLVLDVLDAIDYDLEINLSMIEIAIDRARNGMLTPLCNLCGLNSDVTWGNRFRMTSDNWETEIPKIESVIAEMKLKGY